MDIIVLQGLAIETIIGVYEWERKRRQTVVLTLEMSADVAKAAVSDDLADALDYHALSERLIEYVENSAFQLIETLAERVCELVRNEFGVAWLRLTLEKPDAVAAAKTTALVIERGAQPGS